jgi:hypothetical protein
VKAIVPWRGAEVAVASGLGVGLVRVGLQAVAARRHAVNDCKKISDGFHFVISW